MEAPTTSDGDHCGEITEEEETVGEAAEGVLEETVVKSFALKDSDKPVGLLVELRRRPEELPSPSNEVTDIPLEMLFRLDEAAVEAVGIDEDCSAELEASELLLVAERLWGAEEFEDAVLITGRGQRLVHSLVPMMRVAIRTRRHDA